MQYAGKEISELDDLTLIQSVQRMNAALEKRQEASKHPKFDKNNAKNVGSFPPPNPVFLEIKNALENEMIKRKLEIEK
jgi:hypothetical protein